MFLFYRRKVTLGGHRCTTVSWVEFRFGWFNESRKWRLNGFHKQRGQKPGGCRHLTVHQNPWFSCSKHKGFDSRAKKAAFTGLTATSWKVRVTWGTAQLRGRVNKQHEDHPYKAIYHVQINTQLVLLRHYLSDDLNSGHSLKSLSMQISFWAVKIWFRKCMTSLDIFYLSQFWIIYRL